MDQKCATPNKQQLVQTFDELALRTLKALSEMEHSQEIKISSAELAVVMQGFNAFARSVDAAITGTFVKNTLYEPNLYVDDRLEDEMQQNLKEILTTFVNILTQINAILTSGFDIAKKENIEKSIGKLLLMLRFDILSLPEDVIQGVANMGNVYAQIKSLGILDHDHFLVRHLWQSSARRFLPKYDDSDVAIVMQGPIKYEDNFTLETLLRYRKIYPNVSIIVSTWEGEVTEEFRLLAELCDIDIVENSKPSTGGPWNIKFQLKSSIGGINKAAEKESKYVMKTRTDQVFLHPDFLIYMKNVVRTFPASCDSMSERIVFLGAHNSMCTYPFRITDFMTFGRLEDIRNFYSATGDSDRLIYTANNPVIKRNQYLEVLGRTPFESFSHMLRMDETARRKIVEAIGRKQDPESYMVQSFYERVVYKKELCSTDDILLHYWKFIKNCTVFIDPEELLFFWAKYSDQYMNISSNVSDGGLTHAAWMSIYYSDL